MKQTATQLTLYIKIPKAGTTMMVDVDRLTDAAYRQVLEMGLQALLNRHMSKIGSVATLRGPNLWAAHAAASEIAEKNLSKLTHG